MDKASEAITDRFSSHSPMDQTPQPQSSSPLLPLYSRAGASKELWLGFCVSVGLHLGLLFLPLSEPTPTPPKPPEKQIRITQLSRQSPNLIRTIAAPKKPTKPTVKAVVRRQRPLLIPQTKAPPQPSVNQPQEPASAGTWDDFPIYEGAQSGCFGLASCFQTTASLSQVADFYTKALPAKKYDFKQMVDTADRLVFQVSRNKQSQFLSVLRTKNSSVFVLSNAPRSLEDVTKAIELPPELIAILGDLDAQNADPANFVQPDLFYTRSNTKSVSAGTLAAKPQIRNISLIPGQTPTTIMNDVLRSKLQVNDFEITDLPQPFGNGNVYQVKKGDVTFYLNLVPTKDSSGTLVVAWKERPK